MSAVCRLARDAAKGTADATTHRGGTVGPVTYDPATETAAAPLEPLREDWQRALAVVAHPDDMEFGAAAAVARWTGQGKQVVYCMVTSGEAGIDGIEPDRSRVLREAEQVESARIVGVDVVQFLGLPDGILEYGVPLRRVHHRGGATAPARDRDHRQLPGHIRWPQPQPGRPHRGGQGNARRRA